jgi:hypothetical protein
MNRRAAVTLTPRCGIVVFLILLLSISTTLHAVWLENGAAICNATDYQGYPRIISDGMGGAIIVWEDLRNGGDLDIYAQAVDACGTVQWTADGVPICTAAGSQGNPHMAADGSGGAIITWYDKRDGEQDIYAQAIRGNGQVRWTVDGVALCTADDDQWGPRILYNGAGRAIITWFDDRNLPGDRAVDIYARAVDTSGTVRWTSDGIAICRADGDQWAQAIASDGGSGAIIAWEDYRPYYSIDGHDNYIYVQAVDYYGTVKWPADGLLMCNATGRRNEPEIIPDGSGGAIITWSDVRSGNRDIYAQAITETGWTRWTWNGIEICTAGGHQYNPEMVSDGSGGAIIVWYDSRNGNYDIYAQAVDASGTVRWAADGIPICTATGIQYNAAIAPDGAGGAVIAWCDARNGDVNIYAQAVDASGTVKWDANGIAVSTAAVTEGVVYITTDGAGGAIVSWGDYRNGDCDVYAMRVEEYGYTGDRSPVTVPHLSVSQNYPNPFNPSTTVRFVIGEPTHVHLGIYDVSGALVRVLVDESLDAGAYQRTWDGFDEEGGRAASGVYFCRIKAGALRKTMKMVLLR